jgi:hypothetical protein
MHLLTRLIALTRGVQLRRQFRDITEAMGALPAALRRQLAAISIREFTQAAKCEFPHLYMTPPEDKYRAWGSGTEIGMERLRSDNIQVRLRGIALWLVVVYHETREAPFGEQKELHREVMRTLRVLKESVPTGEAETSDVQAA